jgi:hypothetical protein
MTNNTQFDHQDGGRNRKPGQRSRTTKLRAIGIAGAFLAFGALVTSDAADAAGYSQRNRAAAPLGYGYNTQANLWVRSACSCAPARRGLGQSDHRPRSGSVHPR